MLYRNAIFSNVNPKRAVNYHKKLAAADLEWSFKREFEGSESCEGKLVSAIFQQLSSFKRQHKTVYEQLKQLLRSPGEIGNTTEIIALDSNRDQQNKDIDFTELKKMVNIIMRFHQECLGSDRELLCGHLTKFCSKIGIKFT
jgi:hypothetical protein